MKNSKKGIWELLNRDPRFAERTGVLRSLRHKHPTIIEPMIKLLVAADEDCENHLHEFVFALDGIAILYGRRLNSPIAKHVHPVIETHPDYVANQRQRQERLEKAAECLKDVALDLCQLDVVHFQRFLLSYKSPTGRTNYERPMEVIGEINLACHIIAACEEAHSSIFKETVKRRGRKPARVVDATRELITLWEKYTGKNVPTSKTHQHKVTTNAAQFIRLGISLIDPNASDANVVTAINNALLQSSQRKRGKRI